MSRWAAKMTKLSKMAAKKRRDLREACRNAEYEVCSNAEYNDKVLRRMNIDRKVGEGAR